MNVLYLNTHDIGQYLQTYGYAADTPNLLAFSGEGMAFSNMYCASPTCSPSRGALLTGQFPHSNGLIGLSHRGFPIDGSHHLAAYLRGLGYETVVSGVQHEIRLHEEGKLGYEKCLNPPEYYRKDMPQCDLYTWQDEMAAANAVKYLQGRRPGDRPFFLAVGFGCTHREYPRVPEDYETDNVRVPDAMPDTPEIRRDMAAALIAIHTVDRLCGDILQTLRETGDYDDTLIFFTTDHGLPLPAIKCNLYDDGTRVAFLMRYPGMPAAHRLSGALLSQVDVFPTICDILKTEKPDWLQGHSFLPVILGEQQEIQDQVFGEVNYHVGYEPMRSVRTRRYKYIVRWENGYPRHLPANVDDSPAKEVFRQAGYFEKELPREELYDLLLDPQERDNLAQDPGCGDVLAQMRSRLKDWQTAFQDPLLTEGKIALPPEAICSTPDSYSTKTQVILPECRKNLEALKDILQNHIA